MVWVGLGLGRFGLAFLVGERGAAIPGLTSDESRGPQSNL